MLGKQIDKQALLAWDNYFQYVLISKWFMVENFVPNKTQLFNPQDV